MGKLGTALTWFTRGGKNGDDAGRPPEARQPQSVILLGIDDFEAHRALLGIEGGRSLMRALVSRLRPYISPGTSIAEGPAGTAEISLPMTGRETLRTIARTLARVVATEGLQTPDGDVFATVSAGCSTGATRDAVRATAHDALRSAQAAGRARCLCLDAAPEQSGKEDFDPAVLTAVEQGAVEIAFQPVLRIDAPGAPAFFDCLARLPGSEPETPDPASFLPAVRAAGLAPALERRVLDLALRHMALEPRLRLALTVSPETLRTRDWLDLLRRRSASDAALADRLIVQVAEADAAAAPVRVAGLLTALRQCGPAIALDRCGEEGPVLPEFDAFGFDMVRLSPVLCDGIAADAARQRRATERITAASQNDLMIVASGLLRVEDAEWLTAAGATHVQGSLFSPPLAAPTLAPADGRTPELSSGRA